MAISSKTIRRPVSAVSPTQPTPQAGLVLGTTVDQIWRAAFTVVGGLLVLAGMRRRSLTGLMVAIAGTELIREGATGESPWIDRLSGLTFGLEAESAARGLDVIRAVTIRKRPDEIDRLWRDPATLRRLMEPFADVTMPDRDRLHWVLRGPQDMAVAWDAQILEDRPGQLIRWQSLPGALLPNEGSLHFRQAPGDRGTEVVLRMRVAVPGGELGKKAAKLIAYMPSQLELKTLYRLKNLAETGEIATLEHQPACRNDGRDE